MGTTDQAASADLTGLAPNTTYHFRVVANNKETGISRVPGADQTFNTFPAGLPTGLPDGRGYEEVTPPS